MAASESTDEWLKKIVAEILELDATALHDGFSQADADQWDSLNALRMVTAVESEFGIRLSMDEIGLLTTFGAIRATVGRHLA